MMKRRHFLLGQPISKAKWVRFDKKSVPTVLDLPVQGVRVELKIVRAGLEKRIKNESKDLEKRGWSR